MVLVQLQVLVEVSVHVLPTVAGTGISPGYQWDTPRRRRHRGSLRPSVLRPGRHHSHLVASRWARSVVRSTRNSGGKASQSARWFGKLDSAARPVAIVKKYHRRRVQGDVEGKDMQIPYIKYQIEDVHFHDTIMSLKGMYIYTRILLICSVIQSLDLPYRFAGFCGLVHQHPRKLY